MLTPWYCRNQYMALTDVSIYFASKFEVSKKNIIGCCQQIHIYTTDTWQKYCTGMEDSNIYFACKTFLLESIDSLMTPLSNLLLPIIMKPTFSNFVKFETKMILEYLILTFLSFLNTLVQTKLDVGNMSVHYHLSI